MGLVARLRLVRHWRSVVAAGLLLGIGFGLSFACFAAARATVSVYDRVLVDVEAPDAAVAFGILPEDPEKSARNLATIDGIVSQRVYAGFTGRADGLDPVLSTALIAPIRDRFPVELPKIGAGRLPSPPAADEVFANQLAADGGNLRVGQQLHFRLVNPYTQKRTDATVRITGIGAFPAETVADETGVLGVFVFTRAFFEAHRDLMSYSSANVDLAPGFDARRDLAPALAKIGYQLQSARDQEQQAVIEALRPLTIVIVALGILAFAATTVGAAQVVQRNRNRFGTESATLRTLGMTRGQVRSIELVTSSVLAALTIATAVLTMLLGSPVEPIGPLHDFDPAQGLHLDAPVAVAGAAAIVVTFALLTLALSAARRHVRRTPSRATSLTTIPQRPAAMAGVALAVRSDDGRRRARRSFAAPTAATIVLALSAAFVASSITLTSTPSRYGFDADVLALNAYGDQAAKDLERVFGDNPDVAAATAFTSGSFLVFEHAVPGLAMTPVKGTLLPTMLRGRAPAAADEIALGADTLAAIGADLGDVVGVRALLADGARLTQGNRVPLRIVGVATFPAVNQIGTDMARLGVGALVTIDAFKQMHADQTNHGPDFTSARLVDGADRKRFIDAHPEAFKDIAESTTAWFSDAKAAELQQLDAALPYLRGALAVGYAILLAVMVHALWARARANRRPLAVLRAMGCTRAQLDAVSAWQAAPYAAGAIIIGIPIGVILGRGAYRVFARSLAVVDDPTTSAVMIAGLAGLVLLASVIAAGAGILVARRARTVSALRGE